jgi:uncharacterized protein DUF6082
MMLLGVLSTLISSVALIGVAVSLFLQSRQLRANQVQIAHASQLELMKSGLDRPSLIIDLGFGLGAPDEDTFIKYIYLNWYINHLSTTFDLKTTSKLRIQRIAEDVFTADVPRKWWVVARESYRDRAVTRRQKEFFAIVDGAFQKAQGSESSKHPPPDESASATSPRPPA